jgi:hypothetical protein
MLYLSGVQEENASTDPKKAIKIIFFMFAHFLNAK